MTTIAEFNAAQKYMAANRKKLALFPDLVAALQALLWPNVPSGDDVALLIAMGAGGSRTVLDSAMELAQALRKAQKAAREVLDRVEILIREIK